MNQSVLPSSDDEEHMLGHGFYNKHSHAQGEANTYGLPLIIEAINQIDLGQIGTEFRIANYGSASDRKSARHVGGTSQSRLGFIFAISGAGNAMFCAPSNCWKWR
jgi:hypothetical protein